MPFQENFRFVGAEAILHCIPHSKKKAGQKLVCSNGVDKATLGGPTTNLIVEGEGTSGRRRRNGFVSNYITGGSIPGLRPWEHYLVFELSKIGSGCEYEDRRYREAAGCRRHSVAGGSQTGRRH